MTLKDVGMYSQWRRIGKLAKSGDAALVVLLLSCGRTEREGHAGRGGTDRELAVVGDIVVGGNLLLLEVGGHGVLCRGSVHGIACVLVGAGEVVVVVRREEGASKTEDCCGRVDHRAMGIYIYYGLC